MFENLEKTQIFYGKETYKIDDFFLNYTKNNNNNLIHDVSNTSNVFYVKQPEGTSTCEYKMSRDSNTIHKNL